MTTRLLAIASLFAPAVVFAAPRTFAELAALIVFYMNNFIATLVVLAVVIYFFGTATFLMKKGGSDKEGLRKFLLLGLVTIFVMVSVWGILRILQNTLFSSPGSFGTGGPEQDPCLVFGECE